MYQILLLVKEQQLTEAVNMRSLHILRMKERKLLYLIHYYRVEPEGGKWNLQSKLMHQISENRLFKFPKPTRLRKKKNKIEQSSDISKG